MLTFFHTTYHVYSELMPPSAPPITSGGNGITLLAVQAVDGLLG
jgi:hypothetical protein